MGTTKLSKAFNKGFFHPGASELKLALWYFTSLLVFRSGLVPFSNVLVFILKAFGARIGKDVRIKPFVHIRYPWRFEMGDHCWIADCYIENLALVKLGDNVCVSQGAMLLTGNHDFTKPTFDLITKPIILEDGVWIGARAIVCPGVKAKSHAVLTVGSVATADLPPYSINRGNPAHKIKDRALWIVKSEGLKWNPELLEMAFI